MLSESGSKNPLYENPDMDVLKDTSSGKSLSEDDPVYPERVRFKRKGKEAGSLMLTV